MAATVTISNKQFQAVSIGGLRARIVDVAFAASDYPTAGYSITPNSVGLSEILGVSVLGVNESAQTVCPTIIYNVSTKKLQAFGAAGGATGLTEIANNGDISLTKVRLLVFGV